MAGKWILILCVIDSLQQILQFFVEKVKGFCGDYCAYREHSDKLAILRKETDEKEKIYQKELEKLMVMMRSGTYSKQDLEAQNCKLEKYEMEYERASYLHEEYFGRHIFSTELAAVGNSNKQLNHK